MAYKRREQALAQFANLAGNLREVFGAIHYWKIPQPDKTWKSALYASRDEAQIEEGKRVIDQVRLLVLARPARRPQTKAAAPPELSRGRHAHVSSASPQSARELAAEHDLHPRAGLRPIPGRADCVPRNATLPSREARGHWRQFSRRWRGGSAPHRGHHARAGADRMHAGLVVSSPAL